ncbi:MAG: DUF1801 domain-containing protein [Kofleriaceae bacterium]
MIDQRIRDLDDWRGVTLARMRQLVLAVDDEMLEEWKWRGTPVWSRHGIVCTGESYAKVVKLTFAHGARLPDPTGLFNASLEGSTRRAIDLREGEQVDARAFTALVKAAVAFNAGKAAPRRARTTTLAAPRAAPQPTPRPTTQPRAKAPRQTTTPSAKAPPKPAATPKAKAPPKARSGR